VTGYAGLTPYRFAVVPGPPEYDPTMRSEPLGH